MNEWDVTVGGPDAAMRRDFAIADEAATAADAAAHRNEPPPRPWSLAVEITVAGHKVIVLEAIIGGRLYTETSVYSPDGSVERSGSTGAPLRPHEESESP